MIIDILLIIIAITIPILFYLILKKKLTGYRCINNKCIYTNNNSQFRTLEKCKEQCENTNNKLTKSVNEKKDKPIKQKIIKKKTRPKPPKEIIIKHKQYRCDESNCTCSEADSNWVGPVYNHQSICELNCANCHNNLTNSYAIKPSTYYSAFPNVPYSYPYSYPYLTDPYDEDPYLRYPYGLEPPPVFRPSLCSDRR